jgi:enamine deaminase RidA (YjgF/YER057c/UK114 family)
MSGNAGIASLYTEIILHMKEYVMATLNGSRECLSISIVDELIKVHSRLSGSMIEQKLDSLGISLRTPPKTIGSYSPVLKTGNLLFVSGQLPIELGSNPPNVLYKGKVGKEISIRDGKEAAKLCTLNALTHLKDFLAFLDNIEKFVKVTGYVNCDFLFTNHPEVINGASDFLVNLFGQRGMHSRVSLGVSSLPLNSAVEIDFILEVGR